MFVGLQISLSGGGFPTQTDFFQALWFRPVLSPQRSEGHRLLSTQRSNWASKVVLAPPLGAGANHRESLVRRKARVEDVLEGSCGAATAAAFRRMSCEHENDTLMIAARRR